MTSTLDATAIDTGIELAVAMRRRRFRQAAWIGAAQLGLVLTFVGLWELGARRGWLDSFMFSRPSEVAGTLRDWWQDGSLFANSWASLKVLLIGWGIGVAVGAAIGIALGLSQLLREIFDPFVAFFNAMPRLLLLPVFIVIFGFTDTPRVLLVVSVIIFMVIVSVESGVRDVSVDVISNARLLGAGRWALIRSVYVPGIALWILTSARTTVGYAFQATIAAELVTADVGLGALVLRGKNFLDIAQVFAALVVMFFVGMTIDASLAFVQRRTIRWMPSTR